MKTTRHLNQLDLNPTGSFILQVGRKRQLLNKRARFEAEMQLVKLSNDDLSPTVPLSQTYKLFIDDDLFASVIAYPKVKYQRSPIRLVKPKNGPVEIHLVKKYVTFH